MFLICEITSSPLPPKFNSRANPSVLHSRYRCQCTRDFVGYTCELSRRSCLSNPCSNSATCHNMINGYFCKCLQVGQTGAVSHTISIVKLRPLFVINIISVISYASTLRSVLRNKVRLEI